MKDEKKLPVARLGNSTLGECKLLSAADHDMTERHTYEQVHGFTFGGEAKFLAFFAQFAQTSVNVDVCRASCLGGIEDNLNADLAHPLDWELSAMLSRDGQIHRYRAELDDFIIESVFPDE
ncbi:MULTISPECIES: hypothetical protein [Pseudomonas syringae group]|uniref:Uncharacterized protein n=1 Tax=Pseudomonas syringae pv. persicae TaxID=237306 RepID=A0A3M3ZU92_9PSED|nr:MULTISPECIES: hypothetical protein [Pseudomonas syringae group]QOQ33535.1 hypothetical protein [Pseudomonas syringae pv. actinidiae]RMO97705.1 hypothetical protein ALQ30_200267 [Pseudomonas syringae pv. persicae]